MTRPLSGPSDASAETALSCDAPDSDLTRRDFEVPVRWVVDVKIGYFDGETGTYEAHVWALDEQEARRQAELAAETNCLNAADAVWVSAGDPSLAAEVDCG